ncbi:HAMP domain-containing protein [Calditrichota bacterium LG25]
MSKFFSIRWKISGLFLVSNIILGVVIALLVSNHVRQTFRNELIERGRTIGHNLASNSGDLILNEDKVGLRYLIANNMNFESLDYILVHDSEGKIIGDNFNGQVPKSLQVEDLSVINKKESSQVLEVPELNTSVYDLWVPVEEGLIGYIRIGLDTSYVRNVVNQTIKVILLSVLVVTLLGGMFVFFLGGQLVKPIIYLTRRADEISQGKLEQKIELKTHDEIEKLAEALDRLRESVKIALKRLEQQQSLKM